MNFPLSRRRFRTGTVRNMEDTPSEHEALDRIAEILIEHAEETLREDRSESTR